jgi:hypothetical protein
MQSGTSPVARKITHEPLITKPQHNVAFQHNSRTCRSWYLAMASRKGTTGKRQRKGTKALVRHRLLRLCGPAGTRNASLAHCLSEI